MAKFIWLIPLISLLIIKSSKAASCTYGARGSLTSTCVFATPTYFRSTSYRFDNLDETVRCLNCTLQILESNTFDISGNQIKTLDLTNSQIAVLKPKAFIGLVFMERLLMPNNKISGVPAETFMGVNKVQELNLENNSIKSLASNGFKELTNLKNLNLKSNLIETIESGSFNGLTSLEILDLTNNNIESVKDVFNSLSSISIILLQNNKIAQIDVGDFKPLYTLLNINFGENKLTKVQSDVFVDFPSLTTLNLTSNPISDINIGAFRGLNSLDFLDLSKCAIKNIPKGALQYLHNLRTLDLASNKIEHFTPGLYTSLPELRILNLSHNEITYFQPPGVFKLNNLHTLDVSDNKLTNLDFKLLIDYLPSLSKIILSGNSFPCYLGKDMEDYFKRDNLVFNLGQEYDNVKCNSSRPLEPYKEVTEKPEFKPETAQLVQSSDGHEYVLYIFIFISLGLTAFLFYMQWKTQLEIRKLSGHSNNIAEVHLLSAEDG